MCERDIKQTNKKNEKEKNIRGPGNNYTENYKLNNQAKKKQLHRNHTL